MRELVLIEKSVWLVIACFFKEELSGTLWDTEHVSSTDSEVETDRVSLNELLSGGILVVSSRHGMQILGIIVEVVVVIDDDGFLSVHILNDPEWIELDLV